MSLSDASQPEVDFLQSLIGSGFAQSFGQMVSVRLLTCVAQLHTLYPLFSLGKSLQLVRSLIGAARVRFVNHKYDFRQKFQDRAFNYHFVR